MRDPESNALPSEAFESLHRTAMPAERLPWACWLNVLSLDAVLVASLWQFVFVVAFCGRFPNGVESFVLAAVVWLIYVADRLLDAARLDLSRPHLVRHRMYRHHGRVWRLTWVAVLLAASAVVVAWMDIAVIRMGLLVATSVLAYGAGVHFWPGRSMVRHVFAKEVQVGVIFAAGVSLIAWSEAPSISLALSIAASAMLFTANCRVVAKRESVADQSYDADRMGDSCCEGMLTWGVAVVAGVGGLAGWMPWLVVVSLIGGSIALIATTFWWRWKGDGLSEWSRWSSSTEARLPWFDRWVPMADWSLMVSPMIGCAIL